MSFVRYDAAADKEPAMFYANPDLHLTLGSQRRDVLLAEARASRLARAGSARLPGSSRFAAMTVRFAQLLRQPSLPAAAMVQGRAA